MPPEIGVGGAKIFLIKIHCSLELFLVLFSFSSRRVVDISTKMVLAEFVIRAGGQNEFVPSEVNFMRGCEHFVMERNEKEKSNRFLQGLFCPFFIRVECGTDLFL